MKKAILFLLVATMSIPAIAQRSKPLPYPAMKVDETTKMITYEGVGKVDGVTAKDNGEIEIFARFPIYAYDKKGEKTTSNAGLIQYTMILQFKDGRYKYLVNGLNLKAQSHQPIDSWLIDKDKDPNADNHAYQLRDIDLEINALIKDMLQNVAKKQEAKGDDW